MVRLPLLLAFFISLSFIAGAAPGHGHCHFHSSGSHHFSGHHIVSHSCVHHFHYHPTYHVHVHTGHYNSGPHVERIIYPLNRVSDAGGSVGTATFATLSDTTRIHNSVAAINASYRYFVTRGLALGISGSFQPLSGTSNLVLPSTPFNFTGSNTTVAADLTWLYSSREWYQSYGGIGGGVSFMHEHDIYTDHTVRDINTQTFAFQFTLLGIRVGRSLGAYAELGLGYKGLINAGISWQGGRRF